jgi:serine protease inhibitor
MVVVRFLSERSLAGAVLISSPSSIVDANSRFAFKVFKQLTAQTPDHNVLLAPTGLSLTFGLLENGSDPETRKEVESTFQFTGLDIAQVNAGFARLRKEIGFSSLSPQPKGPPLPSAEGDSGEFLIADSLWIRHGYFADQFLNANREFYGLDLQRVLPSPDLLCRSVDGRRSRFGATYRSI